MGNVMRILDSSAVRWGVVAAGLLAVAGCSSPAITSERNSAVPIPAGATVQFRGHTSSTGTQADPRVAPDSVHRFIQQAIIAQLKAKGYALVDTSTPATFTVRYYLAVKVTTNSYGQTGGGVSGPAIQGYGYGYGERQLAAIPAPEPIKNASFEVDLVDERAGRTAWRGVLQAEPKDQPPTQQRVNGLVADVMKSLPAVP
jgi:hypothetical protein